MFKTPCPACGANLAWSGLKLQHHSLNKTKQTCPKCGVALRRKPNWPAGLLLILLMVGVFFGVFRDVRDNWSEPAGYVLFALAIAAYLYAARKTRYEFDKVDA